MFVEGKQNQDKLSGWFEARARAHPGVFTAFLVVLAVGITIGLLYKTTYAIVLYQGF
jgi:hypothetical protein